MKELEDGEEGEEELEEQKVREKTPLEKKFEELKPLVPIMKRPKPGDAMNNSDCSDRCTDNNKND